MSTTTHNHQGPAQAGFTELDAIDQAEANINKRLGVLNAELRDVGWRGRPAIEAIPGVSNGDRGVAAYGQISDLLAAIPREQAAAAREGRDPTGIAKIEAELEPLEQRSARLRAEIAVLVLERRALPGRRTAVVRRHYSAFALHAREVARGHAEHANQFIEAARQVLDDRGAVYAALNLVRTGKPNVPETQWLEMSRHLVAGLVPWTTANQPALVDLWRAIEVVAAAGTFPVAEPAAQEAA